jgi:hypothetical protein
MLAIIVLWVMRILDVIFFAGMAGCLVMIVLSWADIFMSEFSGE